MKKTVYITGADRGLGLALSRTFLEKGFKVFAGSYLPEWPELQELKKQAGANLDIISLDVTNQQSVDEAAQYIKERAGQLDILINNAAIFQDRSEDLLGGLNFEDMKKIIDTNTFGPLRVSQSVVPLLLKGTNKMLVSISSEAGSITDSWRTREYGYCMSKSALNMQLTIIQNHLKEYGIKVLAFHPGYVKSYMLGHFNQEATVEAMESAAGIVKEILKAPAISEHMFIDFQGNKMNW